VGVLLVLILVGHNFVFNQPQALQDSIMQVHQVPMTQFNLLYTLQTLPTIFLIIPLGVLYDSYGPKMLIPSAFMLVLGQVLMIVYTPLKSSFSFIMMITGRVFQGIGAEILYMGQGVLATKWMGNLVGLILVLP
jgi:MFS family permease